MQIKRYKILFKEVTLEDERSDIFYPSLLNTDSEQQEQENITAQLSLYKVIPLPAVQRTMDVSNKIAHYLDQLPKTDEKSIHIFSGLCNSISGPAPIIQLLDSHRFTENELTYYWIYCSIKNLLQKNISLKTLTFQLAFGVTSPIM